MTQVHDVRVTGLLHANSLCDFGEIHLERCDGGEGLKDEACLIFGSCRGHVAGNDQEGWSL